MFLVVISKMTASRTVSPKFGISNIALMISLYFPPEIGGGSTGAWNRAMVLHNIGYSVFVLCGFPAYPTGRVRDPKYRGRIMTVEFLEPFTLIRVRLLPIEYAGFLKRFLLFSVFTLLTIVCIPKILRLTSNRIRIVYARAPIIFSSISGWIYSKITRNCIFIYEAPDLWPEELVVFKTYFSFFVMRCGRFFATLSYDLPDIIITISDAAQSYICREYNPHAPVYGIPVGVDPTKFPKLTKSLSRAELISQNILPSEILNKFIVLYSGIISSAQQMENLAFAAEKLKNDQEIAIVILGEGHEKQKLQQLKAERKLKNFYLLSSQPRSTMPNIISSADICTILLSPNPVFDIALPTKFYEYLACLKPIVGICQGELASVINSWNVGRSVRVGDIDNLVCIIREMKNSPEVLQTMEKNCSIALERFSLDAIASIFLKVLPSKSKTTAKASEKSINHNP
jgi:glycosyltransferase involved in cell wall biosynthesis